MHYKEDYIDVLARKIANQEIAQDVYKTDDHLKECNICKSKLDFLIDFYKNLEKEIDAPTDAKTEELVDEITKCNIIELKYYNPEVQKYISNGIKNNLVLAADSSTKSVNSKMNVVKFASEAFKILLRIIENKKDNCFYLYIISENDEYTNNVLVEIAQQNNRAHYLITNKEGKGSLTLDNVTDWMNSTIFLSIPIVKFIFKHRIKNNEIYKQNSIMIKSTYSDMNVVLKISSGKKKIRRALVITDKEENILLDVIESKIIFSVQSGEEIREIRLYS